MKFALKLAKAGITTVASFGIGSVLSNAVKATTPENVGKFGRVAIGIGTIALGSIAGDALNKQLDSFLSTEDKTPEE